MFKIVQLKFQNLQLSFQNFTTPIAKFTTECSKFCLGGGGVRHPPHPPVQPPLSRSKLILYFSVRLTTSKSASTIEREVERHKALNVVWTLFLSELLLISNLTI